MLFLLASLLLAQDATAANNCKIVQTDVSPFGERTRGGVAQFINAKSAIGVGMTTKDGPVQLKVQVQEFGALTQTVEAGAPLMALLSDGTKLELVTSEEAPGRTSVTVGGVLTLYTYVMELTPEQLESLSTNSLVALRVPVIGQRTTVDWQPSKKGQKRLQELASCLSQ